MKTRITRFNFGRQAENQRLGRLVREMGVALLMILIADYEFSDKEADEVLQKVLKQAEINRVLVQ